MSIKDSPRTSAKKIPVQHNPNAVTAEPTTAGRVIAATRIVMGLVFGWAFIDKFFGLGYATTKGWIEGGSPTKGFLGGIDHGPLGSVFRGWAGQAWADWLFMAGLLGIAVALLAGAGLRIAAATGGLLLMMMWVADWPLARHTDTGELTRSTNPIIDSHLVYALVLVALAVLYAGDVWGLGKQWAQTNIVRRNPWLR
ncbi:hypothetical protein [Actinokineospora xionganensis]|uniref:Thiosulfate dehydrogenase [quinone] large subunit n=1 Tax=Actinokineospora xionganensis TaxID=2684470 RepID=A0ABR7KZG1_9PSEU|nr:hypothetical protein [Actinokineospora xionganensis]MBC6445825.1 hypothetical protein [Actinokineospora xionganensis]